MLPKTNGLRGIACQRLLLLTCQSTAPNEARKVREGERADFGAVGGPPRHPRNRHSLAVRALTLQQVTTVSYGTAAPRANSERAVLYAAEQRARLSLSSHTLPLPATPHHHTPTTCPRPLLSRTRLSSSSMSRSSGARETSLW